MSVVVEGEGLKTLSTLLITLTHCTCALGTNGSFDHGHCKLLKRSESWLVPQGDSAQEEQDQERGVVALLHPCFYRITTLPGGFIF